MQQLSMTLLAEINALQHMRVDELHQRYDEIIPDLKSCRKCETLREEIAYRIQERFYGISVPPQTIAKMQKIAAIESDKSNMPIAGTRLVRDWKGVRHEVIIRADGVIEYGNGLYKSLSAVARKITGTNWNGRLFFGLNKK